MSAPVVSARLVLSATIMLSCDGGSPRPAEPPETAASEGGLRDGAGEAVPASCVETNPLQSHRSHDPSGAALERFHAALSRADAGEGQARVLVYGGSHVAGDHLTGRLRRTLQALHGDAGHGFIPLVPVVEGAWRRGMRIEESSGFDVRRVGFARREEARYGFYGASFTAEAGGAFALVRSDSWGSGRDASRIELLYDRRPGGGHFEVWIDGSPRERLSARAVESQMARRVYEVPDGPHEVAVIVRGDGPVTLFGVVFERTRPGVLVENLGLVGAKARHQLLWADGPRRDGLRARRPDLVVLAYGNNELTDRHLTLAEHRSHFRSVLQRVRGAVPDASCLLVGPTDRVRPTDGGGYEPRDELSAISEALHDVARAGGCAFFDTLAFQGGPGASVDWLARDPPLLGPDLLHLSRDGYHAWADALTRFLSPPACRGLPRRRSRAGSRSQAEPVELL